MTDAITLLARGGNRLIGLDQHGSTLPGLLGANGSTTDICVRAS